MQEDRDTYLARAKERALAEVDGSNPMLALSSLMSDFANHPELADQVAIVRDLGLPLALHGHLDNREALRKFINDFT